MKPLSISFIIPYYKVELALLARAIRSVQALGTTVDWEIWVIDDGTPESEAGHYVEQLKDTCVHYYYQPNEGLGGARNTGMKLAQKEYLHFLDADDYLLFPHITQALQLLAEERPSLLAFGFSQVYCREMEKSPSTPPRILYRGTGCNFMLHHNLHGSAWGYFFRKSAAGGLQFTPGIYHEDEEFTAMLFLQLEQIIVTDLIVYAYFQRKESIVHQTRPEVIAKRFTDLSATIKRLEKHAQSLNGDYATALNKRIDMLQMSMIYNLLRDSPSTLFLRRTLKLMEKETLYPLTIRPYGFTYGLIRRLTLTPWRTVCVYKIFHILLLYISKKRTSCIVTYKNKK